VTFRARGATFRCEHRWIMPFAGAEQAMIKLCGRRITARFLADRANA
jgi:hypothetical protein